jgi:uncharacterized protein
MRIALTGSHGLVGSALKDRLTSAGHEVLSLVRSGPASGELQARWNPNSNEIDLAALEGVHAAIHLAGENLASGRWTPSRKKLIRDSRILGTRLLSQGLASLRSKPRVLISASGVGIYGSRGDVLLTEESAPGSGFLARLCQDWEAAAGEAMNAGIRVAQLRFGIILSRDGGALPKMLPPFRLGLGGPAGHGRQFWSWIALQDVLRAITHVLANESLAGPVNVVSPEPLRNRDFTAQLGRVLKRPSWLPAPAFALRLALGEMADEALMASARVHPERLLASGFKFEHPKLEPALRAVLRET